jgi:hypothetical protein
MQSCLGPARDHLYGRILASGIFTGIVLLNVASGVLADAESRGCS